VSEVPFKRRRPPAQPRPSEDAVSVAAPDYINLFEHAPVGYMLLNGLGGIEKINCTGAALLGWEASWLAGKRFSRWVANSDKPLFSEHQQLLLTCNGCLTQELRVKNRQGRIVTLRLISVRAVPSTAAAATYRCIMVDVSGEQQSGRERRRLRSQLTHAARVNTAGEFASSLAHELNQPLGTVVLNCEAALRILDDRGGEASELSEALHQAREAAAFASGVVRHLRGFLRNTGEQRAVCELTPLIENVAAMFARTACRSNRSC
jgi:PAS domain S-box-containing protein